MKAWNSAGYQSIYKIFSCHLLGDTTQSLHAVAQFLYYLRPYIIAVVLHDFFRILPFPAGQRHVGKKKRSLSLWQRIKNTVVITIFYPEGGTRADKVAIKLITWMSQITNPRRLQEVLGGNMPMMKRKHHKAFKLFIFFSSAHNVATKNTSEQNYKIRIRFENLWSNPIQNLWYLYLKCASYGLKHMHIIFKQVNCILINSKM